MPMFVCILSSLSGEVVIDRVPNKIHCLPRSQRSSTEVEHGRDAIHQGITQDHHTVESVLLRKGAHGFDEECNSSVHIIAWEGKQKQMH